MTEKTEPEVPQISVDDVRIMIDAKENLILLDVRTEGECARGKIENSIIATSKRNVRFCS